MDKLTPFRIASDPESCLNPEAPVTRSKGCVSGPRELPLLLLPNFLTALLDHRC
jgi:hypothetical protein